jgi:autotransporter translocation and assembly factor TamB
VVRRLTIAFVVIAVLGIVVFAVSSNPAVLRWALDQAGAAGVKIEARELSGNLFSGVNAKGARVKLDFLEAEAGEVQVHYDAWALLTRREVRVRGKISDATVSFDPGKLPKSGDGQAAVKLVLEGVELERVKLKLDGRAWTIPDVRASILEQKNAAGPGWNGSARVKLSTDDGAGIVNASYKIPEDLDFRLSLDGDLDARIARYWFKGIEQGRVQARYTITPHSIEGEGTVVNGALEGVPGVHLTKLGGPVKHRADGVIEGRLDGELLGGPLNVAIKVDTIKQRLSVTGGAKPRVQDGLSAFKTGLKGSGALEVTVRGGGRFENLRFEGDATGAGNVTGFPLEQLRASYAFITPGDRLEADVKTNSRLIDGPVGVTASISSQFGVTAVSAKIVGNRVLGAPLAVSGGLRVQRNGSLEADARGRGLGGSVRASAVMTPAQIWTMQGAFENVKAPIPIQHSISGTATATGEIGALEISANLVRVKAIIPGVTTRDFSGTAKLRQRGDGLEVDAKLGTVQNGQARVKGDLASGQIELENLALEMGARVSGTSKYALGTINRFDGRLALSNIGAGGFRLEPISGPFSLEVGQRVSGRFNAPQVQLEYDGDAVRARPNGWRASVAGQDLKLSGDVQYGISGGTLAGSLSALGSLGQLEARADGNRVRLDGNLTYQGITARVAGSGTLRPLGVRLDLRPTSRLRVPLTGAVQVKLGQWLEVTGSVSSGPVSSGGGHTVRLGLENGQPSASGSLDLAALDALLPPQARGNLSGTVSVNFKNTVGNAVFDGRYADFPIFGRAALRGRDLTASARVTGGTWNGLSLEGALLPKLDARASWRGLNARANGTFSSLGFTVNGTLSDALPGLEALGAAGVDLGHPRVRLIGRFEDGAIRASGTVGALRITRASYRNGNLEARYTGDLEAQYRGEPVLLGGLDGSARFQDGKLTVSTRGEAFQGRLEGQNIELGTYTLGARLMPNGRLEADLNAAQAFTRRPEGVVRAAPLMAKATLEGSRLQTDVRAALTGTLQKEPFKGDLRGALGLDLGQPTRDWTGRAQLALEGQGWNLDAFGPWSALQVRGRVPTRLLETVAGVSIPENLSTTVSVDGRASLPETKYTANFNASIGKPPTLLQGSINGEGASYVLAATLKDAQNGLAKLSFASDMQGKLELHSFDPVGLIGADGALEGALALENARIAGGIRGELAGLPINANWLPDGRFDGALGGPVPLEIKAQGWRFPLQVTNASWRSTSGTPFQTQGTIRVSDGVQADGTITTRALEVRIPGGTARLEPLKAQLSAKIVPELRLELRSGDGRVSFDGKSWSGGLGLAYRAWDGLGRAEVTLRGALTDPSASFEAHGPLSAEGSISRREIVVTGGLDLKGASQALPNNLRAHVQSGRALFTANGSLEPLAVRGTGKVVNASVDGEAVALELTGAWNAKTWNARGDVGLGSGDTGSSRTRFEADQDGLNAPEIDLDLRVLRLFGLRGEGRARGTASLPGWSIERGQAALVLDGAEVEGVRGSGLIKLEDGNLGAALSGTLPGEFQFAVNGPLYPLAEANLKFDGLEGELRGRLNDRRDASLALEGMFLEKSTKLTARVSGNDLGLNANWATASVNANGTLDAKGVGLNGKLEITDLSGIAGVQGQLSAELEARNLNLRARNLRGVIEGFDVTGAAAFQDSKLSLETLRVKREGLDVRASGDVLPELGLQLQGISTLNYAPGKIGGSIQGTIQKPIVKLTGALDAAKTGLIAPGTTIRASLTGDAFDIALGGEHLSGNLHGTIPRTSGGGLETMDLALDAPVIWSGANLPVKGRLRWSEPGGFDGTIRTLGDVMGRPLDASLTGKGSLEVGLDWRGAKLSASLPARLDGPLDGALRLSRFDVGALWGKPDALWVESTGKLQGEWNAPQLRLEGRVSGALKADLKAQYLDGRMSGNIVGDGVSANAVLDGVDWNAQAKLEKIGLDSSILPAPFKTLLASGAFNISSQNTTVRATGLDLNADLENIGPINATGDANLKGRTLEADLNLRALDGQARVTGRLGALSDTLKITLDGAKLEKLNLNLHGRAAANLELHGTALDPNVNGQITVNGLGTSSSDLLVNGTIRPSGRLLDPNLLGDLTLGGAATGRFTLEARDLTSTTPRLGLRGSGRWRGFGVDTRLQGVWPKLSGDAKLNLTGVPKAISGWSLNAQGDGRYTLLGDLARGEVKLEARDGSLEPKLTGDLTLDASLERLLENARGRATGTLKLTGTLTQPQAGLIGRLAGLEYAGASLEAATVNGDFKPGREKPLSLTLGYDGGKTVWDGQDLSLEKLPISASGLKLRLDGQGRTDKLDLRFTGALEGWASGELDGRYSFESGILTNLRGTLGGLPLRLHATGNPNTVWDGDLELSGLPKTALDGSSTGTDDANAGTVRLKLTGPFAAPQLEGSGLVAGVRLDLAAKLSPLTARIGLSNPDKGSQNADGAIELSNGALSGALKYASGATRLRLEASGTLQAPRAKLEVSRNTARATADLGVQNGRLDGQVELFDGQHGGRLKLSDDRLEGRVDGLDLAALGLEGYGGRIALETKLKRGSGSLGFDGAASLIWSDLKTPLELPAVGWKLDGTGAVSYASQPGQPERARLEYKGSPGTIQADLTHPEKLWTGTARVRLQSEGRGTANGDLQLDANGVRGTLALENLKLKVSGIEASLTGKVALDRDGFRADGVAQALGGRVTLEEASGGLSDVIPALEGYTGRAPGEIGYQAKARLDAVRLEDIAPLKAVVPYVSGRASGVVQISDAVSAFQLAIPELTLPGTGDPVKVRLSLSGTTSGANNLRFTGTLGDINTRSTDADYGDSFLSGVVTGGELTGRLDLKRAPMHALLGAVVGPLPGAALVSGLARYNLPLERPLDGNLRLALEKIELTGGGDTLRGSAALYYRKGGVELDSLKLDGAGSWRGSGKYTPNGVNLALEFKNTTFTPILGLIPALKDVDPSANGTLKLEFSGDYLNPRAKLRVEDLRARFASINLAAKSLDGTLQDGALELSGAITSDETLGAKLDTTLRAKIASFNPIQLEGLSARAVGALDIKPVGRFENVVAEASGQSGGFKLNVTGKKGQGPFTLTGNLSPKLDLTFSGKNLEFAVPTYFVRESLLDADLRLVSQGRDYVITGRTDIARVLASSSANRDAPEQKPEEVKPAAPEPDTPRRDSIYDRVRFEGVRINAPSGLRLQESFGNLEAGGELLLTGTASSPQLNGALEGVGNKGSLTIGPYTYAIQSATATFAPVDGILPLVKAKGRTEVRTGDSKARRSFQVDLDITVRFTRNALGEIRYDLETKLLQYDENGPCPTNADPSRPNCLSQAELYGLATLGSSRGLDPLVGFGQSTLNTVLNVFVLSEFTRAFKQATGVDIQISTNVLDLLDKNLTQAEKDRVGVAFSFGGYLNRQVYLQYQIDTTGRTAINLNYTTDDNRFSLRLFIPIQLGGTNPGINNSELSASYNFSSLTSLTTSLQQVTDGENKFGVAIRFGLAFRF